MRTTFISSVIACFLGLLFIAVLVMGGQASMERRRQENIALREPQLRMAQFNDLREISLKIPNPQDREHPYVFRKYQRLVNGHWVDDSPAEVVTIFDEQFRRAREGQCAVSR